MKFSRSDFEMQRFEIPPPQPASQSLTHTEWVALEGVGVVPPRDSLLPEHDPAPRNGHRGIEHDTHDSEDNKRREHAGDVHVVVHLQDEVAECGQWLGPQTPLSGHKNRNAPPRTTTASRLRTTIVIPEIYHNSPGASSCFVHAFQASQLF